MCYNDFVSPSALANYILKYNSDEAEKFEELVQKIKTKLLILKSNSFQNFKYPVESFKLKFKYAFERKYSELQAKQNHISNLYKQILQTKEQNVEFLRQQIITLIHKQFAIKNQQLANVIANIMTAIKNDNQNKIIVDGKNVKNATDLKKDDEISIFFNDGIVFAQVINIIKKG